MSDDFGPQNNLIQMISDLQDVQTYRDLNWEGSFGDYLDLVKEDPSIARNAYQRLHDMIDQGPTFDISTYTIAERAFFRRESNLIVTLLGNVRAGFRSDIKSMAIDSGKRACNMHRLEYPGYDQSNICYDLRECDLDGDVRTGLWNEYIATPVEIISVTRVE